MKKILMISALSVATGFVLTSEASATRVAFGPKIGTLGAGLEATVQLNNMLNLRGNVNYFKMSRSIKKSKIDYSGKLKFFTAGAFMDFHPWYNGFRVSAGAMYNNNNFDVHAKPNKNVTINGTTYTPAQMGTIDATVDFRKFSPYVGIGFDNAMTADGNFSFNAELGVLFQGKPRASLKASGTAANNTQFLNDAKRDIKNGANKSYLRAYPVVSVGLKWRF